MLNGRPRSTGCVRARPKCLRQVLFDLSMMPLYTHGSGAVFFLFVCIGYVTVLLLLNLASLPIRIECISQCRALRLPFNVRPFNVRARVPSATERTCVHTSAQRVVLSRPPAVAAESQTIHHRSPVSPVSSARPPVCRVSDVHHKVFPFSGVCVCVPCLCMRGGGKCAERPREDAANMYGL